ncbi:MAG: EthD domain-containing protein [Novosphingobium sp.]|nr:EthD domain-containing protein [Novosphingobium sp.]
MIKVVMLVHRRPGMTFEAFRAHYEDVHVPLALSRFGLLRRYVRNYCDGADGNEPPADCITELWFDDLDALRRQGAETAGDAEIAADEVLFMDRERTRHFVVDERTS